MGNDYAIVIGLQNYPGFDDPTNGKPPLMGPENDAKDFYEWLLDPIGGNVPETNISCILSSKYDAVQKDDFLNAAPKAADIIIAFEKLRQRSLRNQNPNIGLGSKIGRRLYIFMSGHGIAPSTFGNKLEKEAALLMCNVDPTNTGAIQYHIPGGYTANWFCENDCFDQVFLFMDCCRDPVIVNAINMFFTAKGNKDDTTRFYAFSTGWSRKSREKMLNGKMRGVFTNILLQGLKGASAVPDPQNPNNGIITVASLKSFLYNNINRDIDPSFQEPDIEYYPQRREGADIIITTAPLMKFPVVISVPQNALGSIQIADGNLNQIVNAVIPSPAEDINLNLPRGKYLLNGIINSTPTFMRFDILGTESVQNPAKIVL